MRVYPSAQECRENFLEMSKHIGEEVHGKQDAVMWLWRAHNQVSQRLLAEEKANGVNPFDEDKVHPKRWFPAPDVCPKCRQRNGVWTHSTDNGPDFNEPEVRAAVVRGTLKGSRATSTLVYGRTPAHPHQHTRTARSTGSGVSSTYVGDFHSSSLKLLPTPRPTCRSASILCLHTYTGYTVFAPYADSYEFLDRQVYSFLLRFFAGATGDAAWVEPADGSYAGVRCAPPQPAAVGVHS